MPARTVVLEKLIKFNGEAHVPITPGEYTQLTGRAGRRGIDVEGHSVIQWAANLDPQAVAGLASKRTYPLISSFKPTYNMAVNLIEAFGRNRAREVLELSFAQFQADRSVVGLAKTIREREVSLAGYSHSMECHLGDFSTYAALRREISDIEKALKGMLKPEYEEVQLGTAEVRDIFKSSKVGTIAGSYVRSGSIKRNSLARVLRAGAVIVDNVKIESLKRFKDDATEVKTDYECGIGLAGFNDIQIDDVIETFEMREKPRV